MEHHTAEGVFVHPRAFCEAETVGAGTRVWAFAHVMEGAVVGRDCNLGEQVFVESGARIGDRVTVKNGVQVWEGVTLEDDVFVGPNAVFTNDRFPRSGRSEAAAARHANKAWLEGVTVRRGASIGANATILPGLEIGAWATVGAGAVVAKPVPPHALVMGNPAARRGHVCVCGLRLREAAAGLRCPDCGRDYVLQDGVPVLHAG